MKRVKTFEEYALNERGRSYFTQEGTVVSDKAAYTARDLKKAIDGICCYDEVEMDKKELSITIMEKENYMSFYYDADYGDDGAWVGQFEDCCVGINEINPMDLYEFLDEVEEWKGWFEYEYPEKYEEDEDEDYYESNQIEEKKKDGTISDDEEEREEELMAHVESAIDELIAKIQKDADDIGGSFRSPGIIHRVGQLVKAKLNKARIIR